MGAGGSRITSVPPYNDTEYFPLHMATGGPLVVATDPYIAFDSVGGLLRCYYGQKHGTWMRGVSIRDTAKKNIPYHIYIYRSKPGGSSPFADNAPFEPTVDDYADLEIGIIEVEASDYVIPPGANYSKAYREITHINVGTLSSGIFWAYLVPQLGVTYLATTNLKVEFPFWRD